MAEEVKVKIVQSGISQEQSERIMFEVFDLLLGAGDPGAKSDKKAKIIKKQGYDR